MSHKLLSVTHPDTDPNDPVAGDIILANGTPEWIRLPKGDDDKILTMKSGLPSWQPAAGGAVDPTEAGVKVLDSDFDNLALGDIDGKGAYDYAGTWVEGSGAGCSAAIVADPAGGKMLRLADASAVNSALASIDLDVGNEILTGIVEIKAKVSEFGAGSRGYFGICDKDNDATVQGGYFRGDDDEIWYRRATNIGLKLVDAVVDTWYVVRWYFCRLADYGVWWVDGVFEQSRLQVGAGNKFDQIRLSTRDIYDGNVFDIKYIKVWSLNQV